MSWLWNLLGRFGRLFVWWTFVMPWEQAIRVRAGRRQALLGPGTHFCIPYIDRIYRQSTRLRVCAFTPQTLATKDGHTLVVGSNVGYAIVDLERLYQRLHHGEATVGNMALAAIAEAVRKLNKDECTPDRVAQEAVTNLSQLSEFGLGEVSIRVTDFAFLKAIRLVLDQKWHLGGENLDTTRPDATPSGMPVS